LTSLKSESKGSELHRFGSFEEAELAYNLGTIALGAEIEVRHPDSGERLKTTVGRIIFNSVLPKEMEFVNETVDKSMLKKLIARCLKLGGPEAAAQMVDKTKHLGFIYATRSGTTISVSDVKVPEEKNQVLKEAEKIVARIEDQHYRGLITEGERYDKTVEEWTKATDRVTDLVSESMDRFGSVYMMATSGAKGNISQIRQMAGMRGLMTDPSGKIIDFPIRSSFNEGLSVLEYFISTHGARKGLADTALRTSDAGYLTRRLVDIVQDMIVLEEDCGTTAGIWCTETKDSFLPSLAERIMWRLAAAKIAHPKTRKTIVDQNEPIDEEKAKQIVDAGIKQVYVRSPLTCQSRQGVCQACYGLDLSKGRLVDLSTTVGIIAAQSIGEPGTQLTLRTFHTGGVMGLDITTGLPRVEELFEARIPKGQAVLSEIDGTAEIISADEGYRIRITNSESYRNEYPLPPKAEVLVHDGDRVEVGAVLATKVGAETAKAKGKGKDKDSTAPTPVLLAPVTGTVSIEGKNIVISYEEREEEEYVVPFTASIRIEKGAHVKAGDQLTEGHVNPQDILRIKGREAAQRYLVDEIQKVYRSQGVNINDKHIEVIARRMLQKVRVDTPGDTELLPGDLVDRFTFEETNARVVAEGGEAATAQTALLGITKAALNAESWLAAASFQETTRVLTEAAINGKTDRLVGLKENVIIGRLIPAQCLSPEELELTKPPQKDLITQIVDAGLALDSRTEEPAAQTEPDAEIVAELERASEGETESEDEGEAEANEEPQTEADSESE
jgi:DNA-directed RNA polymerase subunit beta'